MHEDLSSFGTRDAISGHSSSWFVYLFASSDCAMFKVGFSCSPLQRIYTFSHRYYERFDLGESMLLPLPACDDARAVEAALKTDLAAARGEAPSWVPAEAGGHTEWFSAVEFTRAEQRLISFLSVYEVVQLARADDYLRAELARMALSFETWAMSQARQVHDLWPSPHARHLAIHAARSLRDWLDAYLHFDLPLFADDAAALEFVTSSARAAGASFR